MNEHDLQNRVFSRMYALWYAEDGPLCLDIDEWVRETGLDRDAVYDAIYDLPGYAEMYSGGGNISPLGIVAMEEAGLADPALRAAQDQVRIRLLERIARYEGEYGRHCLVDWEQLIADAGVSERDFNANVRVLNVLGLTVFTTGRCLNLTPQGRAVVEDHRKRSAITGEFNALLTNDRLTPQARGRRFEGVMKRVLDGAGWQVENNVAIPGEESDLIAHRDGQYFLLELKWLSGPVPPKELDRLIRKVEKRAGVAGLCLSMSGYTKGSVEAARDALTQGHLVLLLGEESIRAMVRNARSFEDVVGAKRHEAVTRRRIDPA